MQLKKGLYKEMETSALGRAAEGVGRSWLTQLLKRVASCNSCRLSQTFLPSLTRENLI